MWDWIKAWPRKAVPLWRNRREPRRLPSGVHVCAVPMPEGTAAGWVRILAPGDYPAHPDGAHTITREHLEQMVQNFERTATDLLIDVEHESLWGNSRAAGWSGALEVREDGLYMRMPEWTPFGQQFIDAREYRYFSPVYTLEYRDSQGRNVGARLLSVALTNVPYMDEGQIDAVGNRAGGVDPDDDTTPSDDSGSGGAPDGGPAASATPEPETTMNRKKLIELLGLAEDATDEQIYEALAALKAEQAKPDEQEPDEAPQKQPDAQGDTAPVSEEEIELRINAAVEQALARREQQQRAERLVDEAISQGKVLPAERTVWVNAARADYDGTAKLLEARKAGSRMPKKIAVNAQPARLSGSVLRPATQEYLNKILPPA